MLGKKFSGIPEYERVSFLILGILGNFQEQEHLKGKRLQR